MFQTESHLFHILCILTNLSEDLHTMHAMWEVHNQYMYKFIYMMSLQSNWRQGIMLLHHKVYFSFHFSVVESVTFFIFNSFSLLGWFLVVASQWQLSLYTSVFHNLCKCSVCSICRRLTDVNRLSCSKEARSHYGCRVMWLSHDCWHSIRPRPLLFSCSAV